MTKRSHKSVAYKAAAMIREYWKNHPNAVAFFKPNVYVDPETFIITSDMKDGWPQFRSYHG